MTAGPQCTLPASTTSTTRWPCYWSLDTTALTEATATATRHCMWQCPRVMHRWHNSSSCLPPTQTPPTTRYVLLWAGSPAPHPTLIIPNAAASNAARAQGHTPAHLASARDVLEVLYEAGASLGQKDLAGRTPLFCCAATNRLDSVLFLLEVDDISIDVPDMRGDTPLHAACCNGFFNCVEFLLQSAADVELLNDQVRCSATRSHTKLVLNSTLPAGLPGCTPCRAERSQGRRGAGKVLQS